jgi:hypothetical protein
MCHGRVMCHVMVMVMAWSRNVPCGHMSCPMPCVIVTGHVSWPSCPCVIFHKVYVTTYVSCEFSCVMSCVLFHVSCVMCHVSCVMCHVSCSIIMSCVPCHVMCHMSCVIASCHRHVTCVMRHMSSFHVSRVMYHVS